MSLAQRRPFYRLCPMCQAKWGRAFANSADPLPRLKPFALRSDNDRVDLSAKAHMSLCGLLAALAALALIAAPNADAEKTCAGATRPASALSPAAENKALLCSINLVRAQNSVPPVRVNPVLRGTALAHSLVMVAAGCFDHQCPGERSFNTRLRAAGYPLCGCAWHASENIAYGAGAELAPAP